MEDGPCASGEEVPWPPDGTAIILVVPPAAAVSSERLQGAFVNWRNLDTNCEVAEVRLLGLRMIERKTLQFADLG